MTKISEINDIIFNNKQISKDLTGIDKIEKSYQFLKEFSKDKVIYGINTGFGPMAQFSIADEKLSELQYNLIRSHCTGAGEILPIEYSKATMLARLSSLLTGYSGVHISVIELLIEFVNRDICPVIYEHGSVGASGDLVQMAHVALCLIGEGEVMYKGEKLPTAIVFEKENLQPITMHIREGLALLNGTSAMTGIGVVNLIYAQKLLHFSTLFSALINEITQSFDDYFSIELNNSKFHIGQRNIAEKLRNILSDSKLIRKRHEILSKENQKETVFTEKIQEHYSLRCVPQILGPIYDEIENCELVLLNEINSANDNPIIDVASKNVYHGGNFHGDYISFEMDKLKIAITRLAMLSERQLNFLCHNKINSDLLPPFINFGTLGLNYGLQACQFTATSTTAECQTLSFPNYVHSIPCNNDNQDIVSMGANSALITKKVIDNAFQVLAIQAMALVQAVDYLKIENKLSFKTSSLYNQIRKIFPVFVEDKTFHKDISNIVELLKK